MLPSCTTRVCVMALIRLFWDSMVFVTSICGLTLSTIFLLWAYLTNSYNFILHESAHVVSRNFWGFFVSAVYMLYHAFVSVLLKLLTYDAMIKGLERSLKLSYSFSLFIVSVEDWLMRSPEWTFLEDNRR